MKVDKVKILNILNGYALKVFILFIKVKYADGSEEIFKFEDYKIPDGAFANKPITSIEIPDTVTEIGEGAFSGCTSLTSVTIPSGVTTIGDNAFSGCTSLTEIIIPDSVTEIGDNAFSDCTGVTSITIGSGVTELSDGIFSGCTSVTSVTIPGTVKVVGEGAFEGCDELKVVIMENGVETIESDAFSGCTSLTSVTIPSSVTTVGEKAFDSVPEDGTLNCDDDWYNSLTEPNKSNLGNVYEWKGKPVVEITLSDGTVSSITVSDGIIKDGTFSGNSDIVAVNIKSGITEIGDGAFSGCTNITSVTIPSSVTTVGDNAFSDCTSVTSITIPRSVEEIGGGAFSGCTNLTLVTIPGSVTTVGDNAFSDCTSLTRVTIPSSVTTVGDNAFSDCTSVTSITIGSGVEEIGGGAFSGCTSLTSVTIEGKSLETIGEKAFDGVPEDGALKCDTEWYNGLTDENKENLGNVYDWTRIGGNVVITYDTSTIPDTYYISDGIVTKQSYFRIETVSIKIEEGIIKISSSACKDLNRLTSVTISNTVKVIEPQAFGNTKLNDITIGKGVTTIMDAAFYNIPRTGTLYCYEDWYNNLDSSSKSNLGALATSDWTKVWL